MVSSGNEVVSIHTSRLKTLAMILLSLGLLALEVWMLYASFLERANILLLILMLIISLVFITFSGFCGLYATIRLFDTKPGLVIDSVGIIDRSNAVSVGRIPWQDIRKIHSRTVRGHRFLRLYVVDSQRYVQRGNFFQRRIHAFNYKFQGSLIEISSGSLKISHSEL